MRGGCDDAEPFRGGAVQRQASFYLDMTGNLSTFGGRFIPATGRMAPAGGTTPAL
jgi:hypothetical protein